MMLHIICQTDVAFVIFFHLAIHHADVKVYVIVVTPKNRLLVFIIRINEVWMTW